MKTSTLPNPKSTLLLSNSFAQVAWVVRDLQAAEEFFKNTIGIASFMRMENIRADETEGTYNGKPGDYVFHLSLAYSGNTMLELIQPVSGRSIYTDFLEKHGTGGVQHVAYTVSEADFDAAVAQLSEKGYANIQQLTLPVCRVAYFDTYAAIGVATEIIGLNEAGLQLVEQLKGVSGQEEA
jgi:uncharacterized glyoxalase superfamily protein PhnB